MYCIHGQLVLFRVDLHAIPKIRIETATSGREQTLFTSHDASTSPVRRVFLYIPLHIISIPRRTSCIPSSLCEITNIMEITSAATGNPVPRIKAQS